MVITGITGVYMVPSSLLHEEKKYSDIEETISVKDRSIFLM